MFDPSPFRQGKKVSARGVNISQDCAPLSVMSEMVAPDGSVMTLKRPTLGMSVGGHVKSLTLTQLKAWERDVNDTDRADVRDVSRQDAALAAQLRDVRGLRVKVVHGDVGSPVRQQGLN